MSFRVISYNILAPRLCDPAHFPKCSPQACNPAKRLELVKDKLDVEMRHRSLLCLQELSQDWLKKLKPFFDSRDYAIVSCQYGSDRSDNMGVAVCYPNDLFELLQCKVQRVSDSRRWPRRERGTFHGWYQSGVRGLTSLVNLCCQTSYHTNVGFQFTDLDLARNRMNQLVMVRLCHRKENKIFALGTYHMPCQHREPNVMMLHATMSANLLKDFANDCPAILAGDFNIKADSDLYTLLSTGALPPQVEERALREMPELRNYDLRISLPLFKSAYQSFLGKEPAFTNYSFVTEPFYGTLDYIWLTDHFEVKDVLRLPDKIDDIDSPLPTLSEPSDHLMIGADLELS